MSVTSIMYDIYIEAQITYSDEVAEYVITDTNFEYLKNRRARLERRYHN